MTLLAMDSFGYYDGTVSGMCLAVEAGHGIDGFGALHYTAVGGGVLYNLPGNPASVHHRCIVGGWLKLGTGGVWSARGIQLLGYQNSGTTYLSMVSGTDGLLEIWRDFGGGSPTLLAVSDTPLADPDTWYSFEAQTDFHTSFGNSYVQIGGSNVLSLTGDNNLGMDSGPDLIEFSPTVCDDATTPCDVSWDDVYTLDGEGDMNNSFINQNLYVKIACLRPRPDLTGLVYDPLGRPYTPDNTLMGDAVPDEDVSFIGNHYPYYTGGPRTQYPYLIPWAPAYIGGVQLVGRGRAEGGALPWSSYFIAVKLDVFSLLTDSFDAGSSYEYHSKLWERRPDIGDPFLTNSINTILLGQTGYPYNIDQEFRVTQLVLEVLYSPLYVPPLGGRYPPQILE